MTEFTDRYSGLKTITKEINELETELSNARYIFNNELTFLLNLGVILNLEDIKSINSNYNLDSLLKTIFKRPKNILDDVFRVSRLCIDDNTKEEIMKDITFIITIHKKDFEEIKLIFVKDELICDFQLFYKEKYMITYKCYLKDFNREEMTTEYTLEMNGDELKNMYILWGSFCNG